MLKSLLVCVFVLSGFVSVFGQNDVKTEKSEYLTVRVKYGENSAGYKYEVYLDIGVAGSHSMSGQVLNQDDVVTISDDSGKHEFKNDMDLVNYLAGMGWTILEVGSVDILDQHLTTYLMQRKY